DEASLNEFERIYMENTAAIVRRAVERLPDELKRVIYCRYYKELSLEKTARMLDIDEKETLSRERKAIRLLRNDKDLRLLLLEYKQCGLL
ncbi:MAG: sigma factor-like helix-turn-helix DNA-binding protein, partial [Candidatus Ornithomonoglobus sp.]